MASKKSETMVVSDPEIRKWKQIINLALGLTAKLLSLFGK